MVQHIPVGVRFGAQIKVGDGDAANHTTLPRNVFGR